MTRHLQLQVSDTHKLSVAQFIEDGEVRHEVALMRYMPRRKSYEIVEVIEVYDVQELFDLICGAYEGDFSIWENQYEVMLDFEVDNDNEPMLSLIIDNDVDNLTIRGKDNDDT